MFDNADCIAQSKYELADNGRMAQLFRMATRAFSTTDDSHRHPLQTVKAPADAPPGLFSET